MPEELPSRDTRRVVRETAPLSAVTSTVTVWLAPAATAIARPTAASAVPSTVTEARALSARAFTTKESAQAALSPCMRRSRVKNPATGCHPSPAGWPARLLASVAPTGSASRLTVILYSLCVPSSAVTVDVHRQDLARRRGNRDDAACRRTARRAGRRVTVATALAVVRVSLTVSMFDGRLTV